MKKEKLQLTPQKYKGKETVSLYNIFEMIKYRNGKQISDCQELKRDWEWERSDCSYKRAS